MAKRKLSPEQEVAVGNAYSAGATLEELNQRGTLQPNRRVRGGHLHPAYRGGRVRTSRVYWAVLVPADDPYSSMRNGIGYILEHRLVMARSLGRTLTNQESVHHVDGNPSNNDLSNLQLRQGPHGRGAAMVCGACGSHDVLPTALRDVS